jgi:hypothetical protein
MEIGIELKAWGDVKTYMIAVNIVASSSEKGRRRSAAGVENAHAGYICRLRCLKKTGRAKHIVPISAKTFHMAVSVVKNSRPM